MRRLLVMVVLLCLTATMALAQDPVKVDPKHYKVDVDNAQVRILRITIGPHEKTPMHEHPASATVWLTDANGKLTSSDGKTEEFHMTAGQVQWSGPEKHWGENTSDKPLELIQVELKSSGAKTAAAQGWIDPVTVDPKHYKVELENDQVRVLRYTAGPHEKSAMHDHPAYIVVAVADGKTQFTLPDGKTREATIKAGQATWNGPEKHASENLGDKPAEAVLIELKGGSMPAAPPAKK